MSRWVQHVSGQGQKWKLSGSVWNTDGHPLDTWVIAENGMAVTLHLPKHEYTLVERKNS